MTVHNFSTQYNTTQNSSDNLPSYLQTNIIAQMLSIGFNATNERIIYENIYTYIPTHLQRHTVLIFIPATYHETVAQRKWNMLINSNQLDGSD